MIVEAWMKQMKCRFVTDFGHSLGSRIRSADSLSNAVNVSKEWIASAYVVNGSFTTTCV